VIVIATVTFACGDDEKAGEGSGGATASGGAGNAGASSGSGGASSGNAAGSSTSGEGGAGESSGGTSNGGTSNGGTSNGGTSSGGSSGTFGGGRGVVDGTLGSSCSENDECVQGLTCLIPGSTSLVGGSPAGGLCTLPCTQGGTTCADLSPTASCVFLDATTAYCFEGCDFGDPTSGNAKCHTRANMACATVYNGEPIGTACQTTEQCPANFACAQGYCYAQATACVPQCNSDADCGDAGYCDFSSVFTTYGLCRAAPPTGDATGATCNVDASTCRGACLAVSDSVSICADGCTFGVRESCGFDGIGQADAACRYLFSDEQGAGDGAACVELCDCNDDCENPGLVCLPFPSDSMLPTTHGRPGYCYLPSGTSTGIACP